MINKPEESTRSVLSKGDPSLARLDRRVGVHACCGRDQDICAGWELDDQLEGFQDDVATTGWVVVACSEDCTPADRTVTVVGVARCDGVRTEVERRRCKDASGEKSSKVWVVSEKLAELAMIHLV